MKPNECYSDATAQVDQAVVESVDKTFADMAFLDVAACPPVAADLEVGSILKIFLVSPQAGELVLLMPLACKRLVVENIYGSQWGSLKPNMIDDCLLEMINVLAGNFLHEYCASEQHNISLPEMHFEYAPGATSGVTRRYDFLAEGEPFRVVLHLDDPAVARAP